ncbi:DUF721 domain-containing protein [Kitasatospora sp. NPDC091207]|uniref:DUF721 domain-containing protein n=1 Tax=Kitasatospora sp. NPDC091207 TaxID=3364083 RepID=UPI00380A16CA
MSDPTGTSPQPGALPRGARPGAAQPAAAPPDDAAPTGADLARSALRAARAQARQRGDQVREKREAKRHGLRSGARSDGRDPVPLGAALNRLLTERGWESSAAVGGVMGRWAQIVGPDIAAHCEPTSYDEAAAVLTVQCDSTAWATQLRWLARQLVARLNHELGRGTVKTIKVLGPAAPVRGYGRLRAPGSKGPGDTWG